MKIVITPSAEQDIRSQLAWDIEQFGLETASHTLDRITHFIETYLPLFPFGAGTYLHDIDAFEVPIPRTPFILFYRHEPTDIIRVLAFFHHAQDRHNGKFLM